MNMPLEFDELDHLDYNILFKCRSWQAKFRVLTDWGKLIKEKPELREDCYLVRGCETDAWLKYDDYRGGAVFIFDSQSRIINGLFVFVFLLIEEQAREGGVRICLLKYFEEASLEKHLTPSRSNGLKALLQKMQNLSGLEFY